MSEEVYETEYTDPTTGRHARASVDLRDDGKFSVDAHEGETSLSTVVDDLETAQGIADDLARELAEGLHDDDEVAAA